MQLFNAIKMSMNLFINYRKKEINMNAEINAFADTNKNQKLYYISEFICIFRRITLNKSELFGFVKKSIHFWSRKTHFSLDQNGK